MQPKVGKQHFWFHYPLQFKGHSGYSRSPSVHFYTFTGKLHETKTKSQPILKCLQIHCQTTMVNPANCELRLGGADFHTEGHNYLINSIRNRNRVENWLDLPTCWLVAACREGFVPRFDHPEGLTTTLCCHRFSVAERSA